MSFLDLFRKKPDVVPMVQEKTEQQISKKINQIIAKQKRKEEQRVKNEYRRSLHLISANNKGYIKTHKNRLSRNYPFVESSGYMGLYGNDYNALQQNLKRLRIENKQKEKEENIKKERQQFNESILESLQDPFNTRGNYLLNQPYNTGTRKGTIASDPGSRSTSPYGGKRKTRKSRRSTKRLKRKH